MARVPVVESPCPIAGKQLPRGATEHCTLCDRSVHNLDRMSVQCSVAPRGSCLPAIGQGDSMTGTRAMTHLVL